VTRGGTSRRAVAATVPTVGLALAGLVLAAGPASAHGDLAAGSPGPGDAVPAGTDLLRLDFDGLADDGRAFVALLDDEGRPVAVGDATVLDDRTACATTAPLEPGVYDVEYLLDADDGHTFDGRYSFEALADSTSQPTDDPAPGPCAEADLAPATEARTLADFGSSGLPTWVPVGLGVLAVGAVGLVVARVRRDRGGAEEPAPQTADAGPPA